MDVYCLSARSGEILFGRSVRRRALPLRVDVCLTYACDMCILRPERLITCHLARCYPVRIYLCSRFNEREGRSSVCCICKIDNFLSSAFYVVRGKFREISMKITSRRSAATMRDVITSYSMYNGEKYVPFIQCYILSVLLCFFSFSFPLSFYSFRPEVRVRARLARNSANAERPTRVPLVMALSS